MLTNLLHAAASGDPAAVALLCLAGFCAAMVVGAVVILIRGRR